MPLPKSISAKGGKYILVILTGLTLETGDTRWRADVLLGGGTRLWGWGSLLGGCLFRHPDIRPAGQSSRQKATVAFHSKHGFQRTSLVHLRGFRLTCPRARMEMYSELFPFQLNSADVPGEGFVKNKELNTDSLSSVCSLAYLSIPKH